MTAPDARHDIRHQDVARIVHDFKSPLATIALEAALFEGRLVRADPLDVGRALDRITRNVEFLDRMVMDLLDLCMFEAGHFELRRARTELCALLEHVIERVVPTRDRSRVFLEATTSVIADVDDLRIERVVANLVHNALKYAPASSDIVVRLDLEAVWTRISVIDGGRALTESEIGYIFDEYRRTRRARAHEGSGLGLYLCKQIVEAHGGRIGVERIPSAGTRFFFELPMVS